jgi:hypothetical protein
MHDTEPGSLIVKGYMITPSLLSAGYPAGLTPCQCTSTCCEGGVYVDLRERDTILAQKELIKASMDESQPTDDRLWFEEEERADPDFAAGRCVATREFNNKCAFLDARGRCTLQTAAVSAGMDRWTFKPLFCILYPVDIHHGRVGFDSMLQDEQPCCTVSPTFDTPLFMACRDELTHLLGPDGYQALEEHYASLQSHQSVR